MLGLWLAIFVAATPETAEVVLTAERMLHDGQREVSTAEGVAQLRSEHLAIDAERIIYDKLRRVVTATGKVVARITQGGKVAVVADVLTLRLDDAHEVKEVYLYDGRAISKKDVTGAALLAASTAEEVEKVGVTQSLLQGNHLVRDGTSWTVEELELVPCSCDFKNPGWSITSTSAAIDTEAERASIWNPVIRIGRVPVLWLPWLSLPLTDRMSGLLFPRPGFTPLNGFMFDQPVFVTLGRSADLTLTPGFFTGSPDQLDAKGKNVGPIPLGVAGPRLGTEFRYAPSKRASGRLLLGLLYDFRDQRDVEVASRKVLGTDRGLRGEFAWLHTQDFDKGFGARVDLNAHSDGDYNRDLTVDVVASSATYLRSTATVFHRGVDHSISLDVGLRQDILWGYDWLGRGTLLDAPMATLTRDAAGIGRFGPGTLQRLPALSFSWSPSQRLGPLRFELEGDAVRLAPLFSSTGDEGASAAGGAVVAETFGRGVDRLFTPNPFSAFGFSRQGIGDRVWQPGEREARDRLMLLPKLSISGQPFGALSATAFAAWRQLAWLGEASGRTWSRGYLVLGGRLETELSRSFADGALRHVIQPLAELRAVPLGVQGGPDTLVPYDAVDAAVPDLRPRFQGVLELRQRLLGRGNHEYLRLDVGQGFELGGATYATLTPQLGELYGRAGVRYGAVSAQGLLRFDPVANRLASDGVTPVVPGGLTRAAGRVDVEYGRSGVVYAAYERILAEGTARSRQPIDLLFLIDRGYTSATAGQQLIAGVRWDFGLVQVRYEALISPQVTPTRKVELFELVQQTAGIGFRPACDCMAIELAATQVTWPTVLAPNVGFNISVSRFGSIGSR